MVRLEQRTDGGQRETPVIVLFQDIEMSEGTQKSVTVVGIQIEGVGHRGGRERLPSEQIDDAKLDTGVEELTAPDVLESDEVFGLFEEIGVFLVRR